MRSATGGAVAMREFSAGHETAAAPTLRRAGVALMRTAGVHEVLLTEAEVVLSELLSNAVRHARAAADGLLHVVVRVNRFADRDEVYLSVSDGGASTAVRLVHRGRQATGGRGLLIVGGLANEWGVVDDVRGQADARRTVWARLVGERGA